jgi:hypothetical protein
MSSSPGDTSPEREGARADALGAEAAETARSLSAGTAETPEAMAVETAAKALELTERLAGTLEVISGRLEKYSVYGRRSRKIIIALAVSFTLDVILTFALGLTAVRAHDTAGAVHQANITSCHNGNSFRAGQTKIWHTFVALAVRPTPGETAAQIAKSNELAAGFIASVERVNRAIDCRALYGK